MLLTLIAAAFGLVAGSALLFCLALIVGGEFDHGGLQVLLIGVSCACVSGGVAWVALRGSKGW